MTDVKQPALSRRHLFAGAGTASALAAVAVALPGLKPAAGTAAAATNPAPDTAGGYQVTQHVLDYYRSARV